tara:strand:- start:1898 stop:2095 length:198 start_codon:yes stop_codon:yes gene_type:complete
MLKLSKLKRSNFMNWINNRLKERTSWDGATLIGFGVVVVFFSPIAKLCAYGAIAYGLWTLITKED